MKFLITISFIFFSFVSVAQPPSPGEHLYWPNMDNFIGTWKWVSGADEVTIKLKKIHYFNSSGSYYADWIMGSHCYIQNGITIENTLSEFPNIGQFLKSSINLWYWADYNTPNILTGILKDPLNNKSERLYLEFMPAAIPTLHWTLESLGGRSYIIGQTPPISAWTLPADIILLKQP